MIILGTNSIKDTGYDVANSCRFNSGSSDNLSIALSSTATNTKKGTLSFWFKTQGFNQQYPIAKGAGTIFYLYFNSSGQLVWQNASTNTRITNQVFRDPTAWSNIVVNFDTTQSTASNRQKMYFNGTEITSFGTSNDLSLNQSISIFDGDSNTRAISGYVGGGYWNGYMSEVVGIDGLQLDPTSFGEFDEDSGIWKPKDVSGLTFGNNGFYLDFEDSSALGADVSGNSNNFTVNNLTAIDQSTDTCTNNFATLNPLYTFTNNFTYSEGNLQVVGGGNSWRGAIGTIGITKGKWFYEIKIISSTNTYFYHGFGSYDVYAPSTPHKNGVLFYNNDGGEIYTGDGTTHTSTSANYGTFAQNDIMSLAVDYDNSLFSVYKNGSALVTNYDFGSQTYSSNLKNGKTIAPLLSHYGSSTYVANFGSPPYSESGGNSDANGYGNFSMAVPSGYFSLNSKNLAEFG